MKMQSSRKAEGLHDFGVGRGQREAVHQMPGTRGIALPGPLCLGGAIGPDPSNEL